MLRSCFGLRPDCRRLVLILLGIATAAVRGEAAEPPSPPVLPESLPGPPAEPPLVLVEGQITDAIGAGLGNVAVSVYLKDQDGSRGALIASATTDRLGDFAARLEEALSRPMVVVFSKPSFLDLVREVTFIEGEPAPYIAETLQGNLTLAGRVESAADKSAIPNASVELKAAYQQWQATTDSQGKFSMQGIMPGGGEITVTAQEYGREHRRIRDVAAPETLIISLKPERIVTLAVTDDLKNPVAAAVGEALDERRGDFRPFITDEQGKAVLNGLNFDAAALVVRLTHPAHVSSQVFDRKVDLPADRAESSHDLVMIRAAKVAGAVTGADGRPVYGARVMTGSGDGTPRAWTDTDGRFQIVGVSPGAIPVTVHMAGHAPEMKIVNTKIAETTQARFELAPGATIRGRVVDSNDQPVSGAEVAAVKWRGQTTLGLRAMTDEAGKFVMDNAPADEFDIEVFAHRYQNQKATVSLLRDEPLLIRLEEAPLSSGSAAVGAGDQAPAITLTALGGRTIDLTAERGKVVVVDFWATWCAPCIQELPAVVEAYEKNRGRKDFLMVGISRDFSEQDLTSFLKEHPQVVWPQVVGEENNSDLAAEKFGIVGIPSIFIIDRDGRIAASEIRADQLAGELERLFQPGSEIHTD